MQNSKGKIQKNMRKVLAVFYRNVDCDGCQVYLLNTLSNMDLSMYQVDFYTPGHIVSEEQVQRFETVGKGTLYAAGVMCETDRVCEKIIDIVKSLRKILQKNHYEYIHVVAGSLLFQTIIIMSANYFGVPIRIAHAQNTVPKLSLVKRIEYSLLRVALVRNATKLLACSNIAAEFLFGKHANRAEVVPNVIDTKKFSFQMALREKYRRNLGVEDSFVIGHVGRFAEQKNHRFLISVFKEILKKEPSAKLLLIGDGPLIDEIKNISSSWGISDMIIFLGLSNDVEKYMCAMDVFVFPSIYEGLGIVNIEAQASGLPCVVSDTCPMEAKVSDLLEFLPLAAGDKAWAERVLAVKNLVSVEERKTAWEKVRDYGYDVHAVKNIYDSEWMTVSEDLLGGVNANIILFISFHSIDSFVYCVKAKWSEGETI